ncbi:MAG: hypothetical protein DMG88_21160 [Acidobacteria bacterium]|nr:MAG: hypothetical protein DMG88_21160 [Acidobacteriota bacterium]
MIGFFVMASRIKPIIFVLLGLTLSCTAGAQIERRDFFMPGGAGRLHVREVSNHRNTKSRNLILLHGGGPGGVPSFDLPGPGYSLAEDFALRGFRVFVMDVRGWGGSKKPHEMDLPAEKSTPLVSTKEAADDIETVVGWVGRRTHEKTALLGWASGGHWACAYASRRPADLSELILLNTLYSINAPWELRSSMQDRANTERFDPHGGGYRIVDHCGAGMRPFQAQTRLSGAIRQWPMRTCGKHSKQTGLLRPAFHPAFEFRLVTKSMPLTFHLDGRCSRRKRFEYRF